MLTKQSINDLPLALRSELRALRQRLNQEAEVRRWTDDNAE
jgi:hypothetical protein